MRKKEILLDFIHFLSLGRLSSKFSGVAAGFSLLGCNFFHFLLEFIPFFVVYLISCWNLFHFLLKWTSFLVEMSFISYWSIHCSTKITSFLKFSWFVFKVLPNLHWTSRHFSVKFSSFVVLLRKSLYLSTKFTSFSKGRNSYKSSGFDYSACVSFNNSCVWV